MNDKEKEFLASLKALLIRYDVEMYAERGTIIYGIHPDETEPPKTICLFSDDLNHALNDQPMYNNDIYHALQDLLEGVHIYDGYSGAICPYHVSTPVRASLFFYEGGHDFCYRS